MRTSCSSGVRTTRPARRTTPSTGTARLEQFARERFGEVEVIRRWSSQYYEPAERIALHRSQPPGPTRLSRHRILGHRVGARHPRGPGGCGAGARPARVAARGAGAGHADPRFRSRGRATLANLDTAVRSVADRVAGGSLPGGGRGGRRSARRDRGRDAARSAETAAAACTPCALSAPTWAASSIGTKPSERGIAPAMEDASLHSGVSCRGRRCAISSLGHCRRRPGAQVREAENTRSAPADDH